MTNWLLGYSTPSTQLRRLRSWFVATSDPLPLIFCLRALSVPRNCDAQVTKVIFLFFVQEVYRFATS